MSTVLNDRDVLLRGARVRFSPPADRAVLLGASANSFRIPVIGSGSPSTITLTAVVLNMTGSVQWTATPAMPMTVSGNRADIKLADMSGDAVVVNASMTLDGVKYEASQTIFKTYDGKPGGMGTSTGLVYAYKRAATAPTDNPGAVTYSFPQGQISTPAADALANGWTKAIPTGTEPLYVCVASASATGDTDAIAANEWSAPVMLARSGDNGKQGADGLNAATVFLYRRTATNNAPEKPAGTVTYTFATGVATGMDSSWTQDVPPDSSGSYLWITTATAAAKDATDTIVAAEWAPVQLMAKNGEMGVSNAVVYAYKRATIAPADNPGAVTYSFAQAKIVTSVLANGWTKTIPDGPDPLYVAAASASGAGATDDIAAAEWAAPVLLAQSGNNGLNTATVFLYRRTTGNTVPAKPSTNVTYVFATGIASGMDGGWTQSVPADAGGKYLWVTTATASSNGAIDIIAASEWAVIRLMAKNGNDGEGERGSVEVVVFGHSSWPESDSSATAIFQNAPGNYSYPVNRDRLTLASAPGAAITFSQTRFYDNGVWRTLDAYINGNMLVNGTLSANALSGGTISGVTIDIGSGNFRVNGSSGMIYTSAAFLSGARLSYDNTASPVGATATFSAIKNLGSYYPAIVASGATAVQTDGAVTSKAYPETSDVSFQTNNCRPTVTNAYNLGTLAYTWMGITSASAVIVTSDARSKLDVRDSELGLDFINALRPVSYRLREGRNVIEHGPNLMGPLPEGEMPGPAVIIQPQEGKRRHYGLIAQEVREILPQHGVDDAAFWALENPDDPDSKQALRYEELISPLIKAVQELCERVHAQQQEINRTRGF